MQQLPPSGYHKFSQWVKQTGRFLGYKFDRECYRPPPATAKKERDGMTFREMNFGKTHIPGEIEQDTSIWSTLLENQGPIIRMWFILMCAYLVAVVIL